MIQQLSKRLEAVASFVTTGNRVADVGTDHGYVPIYLVHTGKVPYAIAMDINKGPLLSADANIKKFGLEKSIETRLSNGLRAYNLDEADSVIIAGMGGGLIIEILSESLDKLTGLELILSPQSDIELVRRFLCDNHFEIVEETMLIDDGKYYTIIKATEGECRYDSIEEYRYGRLLLLEKNPVLHMFLGRELEKKTEIEAIIKASGGDASIRRLEEIAEEKAVIEKALLYYS